MHVRNVKWMRSHDLQSTMSTTSTIHASNVRYRLGACDDVKFLLGFLSHTSWICTDRHDKKTCIPVGFALELLCSMCYLQGLQGACQAHWRTVLVEEQVASWEA
jgi:hypothetical protein